jgi:glycosyltransferase involved in cell wall biosynthesis
MSGRAGLRPTIAVIIPTRDRPETLPKALMSLAHQEDLPDEVVVIDDGSTNPVSEELFDRVAPSVATRLIRNEKGSGANAARNLGAMQSRADFIAFLDDDDEFAPDKIRRVREAIVRCECDIVHHGAEIIYVNEGISYRSRVRNGFGFSDLLVANLVGGTSSVCVRREFLLQLGGFDPDLPALQDWDLWLRAAKHGARFHAIDAALTRYHYRTGRPAISMSINKARQALKIIDQKFSGDLAKLSEQEKRRRQRTDAIRIAHRYALIGQRVASASHLLRGAFIARSPSLLGAAAVSLLGLKFLAIARNWSSSGGSQRTDSRGK